MRSTWWILGLVVAGLVMGGLGPSPAASAVQAKVAAKEFAFLPKALTVPAGTVQFVVTNTGTIEHTFVVDALKVKSPPIKPGQTVTLTATARPGTYQVYCDIPGHKEIGMVGVLTVR